MGARHPSVGHDLGVGRGGHHDSVGHPGQALLGGVDGHLRLAEHGPPPPGPLDHHLEVVGVDHRGPPAGQGDAGQEQLRTER